MPATDRSRPPRKGRLIGCILAAAALHAAAFFLPIALSRPQAAAGPIDVSISDAASAPAERPPHGQVPRSAAPAPDPLPAAGSQVLPAQALQDPDGATSPVPAEPEPLGESAPPSPAVHAPRDVDARPLSPIAPEYPRRMRVLGREGTVRILAQIDADGRVISAEVAQSSGSAMLDNAALAAVRRAVFSPALRGGLPAPSRVIVPIRFALEE